MLGTERAGQQALAWITLCAMLGLTLWMFGY
jgi:hypothetical protein